MIVNVETMKKCEEKSNLSNLELMEQVGFKLAIEIMNRHQSHEKIIVVCGKGNNGGDGFVLARVLFEKGFNVKVIPLYQELTTIEASQQLKLLSKKCFLTKNQDRHEEILNADVLVDAVFGFSFHFEIPSECKEIFKTYNQSQAIKYSIDINSGAEADSGHIASDALTSTVTFALGYKKVFHVLRKDHFLFDECIVIPLDIAKCEESDIIEITDEQFIQFYPKLREDTYKGMEGKPLIVGGCYGMAGATVLNIMGAQAVGSSYIHVACDDKIYNILASQQITPVFHPFTNDTVGSVLKELFPKVKCISFGSGATHLESKKIIFELLLQQTNCPVVLDAEGIRCLQNNLYILKLIRTQVILTPHLQEFADLVGMSIDAVKTNKLVLAKEFAKEYHVILVLKGPNTIVVSSQGEVYINQTGNSSLAKAGSGDFLTGIITGLVSQLNDPFYATIMAVWLHGKAADLIVTHRHPRQVSIEDLKEAVSQFFFEHC